MIFWNLFSKQFKAILRTYIHKEIFLCNMYILIRNEYDNVEICYVLNPVHLGHRLC